MRAWIIADSFLNGRNRRKYAPNTYFERISENVIGVKFHQTFIVSMHKDGTLTLNSGGWNTMTTRKRINDVLSTLFKGRLARVESTRHFMYYRGPTGPIEFLDGMVINETTAQPVKYWELRNR